MRTSKKVPSMKLPKKFSSKPSERNLKHHLPHFFLVIDISSGTKMTKSESKLTKKIQKDDPSLVLILM